jgi:hypothetical protein
VRFAVAKYDVVVLRARVTLAAALLCVLTSCEDSTKSTYLVTAIDTVASKVCLRDVVLTQDIEQCHPIEPEDLQALRVGECISATTSASIPPAKKVKGIKVRPDSACSSR